MIDPVLQLCFYISGLFLHSICPSIQGKHKHIHAQAQHNNRETGMPDNAIGNIENNFENELQRPNQYCFQYRKYCHFIFLDC